MQELESLAKELRLFRQELEALKKTVQEKSFLPTFYKKAILTALCFCGLSLVVSVVATWKIVALQKEVHGVYTVIEGWDLE